jgi:MFS family permease
VSEPTHGPPEARPRLSADFWKYWTGQTMSNLGSSFTMFALPLLVYKLTGSALNLALTTAAAFLPYLLFGLLIGAWVDRVDRKRLMIATNVASAVVIASIPLLAVLGVLSVEWIYAAAFLSATVGIAFNTAEFAAIPSLVPVESLVTANGRIQASFSAASVVGPLLAGALLVLMPVQNLLLFDALSFLVSAVILALIRRSLNAPVGAERRLQHIGRDIVEGLRYVLGHPVLRAISAMMALVNFIGTTRYAQLVLFARERLSATDSEIALLFSAGGAGVVVLSLAAGRLRKRWSFAQVALGALMINGIIFIAFAFNRWYAVGVVLWALGSGLGTLFNINTGSLRQAITPNELLGRVASIAQVLAWSAIPLGALIGGVAIDRTHNVVLVYAIIGGLVVLIPLGFSFTALGHAERYMPATQRSRKSVTPESSAGC